jgi:hypothetical protein
LNKKKLLGKISSKLQDREEGKKIREREFGDF